MENLDDYRETRRTGTTPQQGDYEPKPEKVDPSVLTDDRGNDELLASRLTRRSTSRSSAGVTFRKCEKSKRR